MDLIKQHCVTSLTEEYDEEECIKYYSNKVIGQIPIGQQTIQINMEFAKTHKMNKQYLLDLAYQELLIQLGSQKLMELRNLGT